MPSIVHLEGDMTFAVEPDAPQVVVALREAEPGYVALKLHNLDRTIYVSGAFVAAVQELTE